MHWLYIFQGKVVHILKQNRTPIKEIDLEYDTLTQDDSHSFKVGESFTPELQLEYNKKLWESKGWLPAPKAEIT